MGNNPERDWGRPSWPGNPPSKSARDPKKEGCLDFRALPKAVALTLVAMVRHRKELFGATLVVLALACGGAQHTDQNGNPNCVNAGGRPVPCPSEWK